MIDVGYEIGTGHLVKIPDDRHVAITGQTQLSGKTTTLEALVERSKKTAVAFITKRNEGSFQYGHRIKPYFHAPLDPRTRDIDWQFVESILGITLDEQRKSDPQRLAIIQATEKAKTISQVHENVLKLLKGASGRNRGVYTLLDAYFRKVIPELERSEFTDKLELRPGLNVMDISDFTENLRGLFVRAVAERLYNSLRNTNLIVPEAHSMIPEGKNSPAKAAIRTMIRQSAASGSFVYIDSQDFVGVDKTCLRAVGVWILGVQREYNELKRVLDSFVAVPARPSVDEVMQLGKGQFFISWDEKRAKTYVWPLWADAFAAQQYAMGKGKIPVMPKAPARSSTPPDPEPATPAPESRSTFARVEQLERDLADERQKNQQLTESVEALKKQLNALPTQNSRQAGWDAATLNEIRDTAARPASSTTPAAPVNGHSEKSVAVHDLDTLMTAFRDRAVEEPWLVTLVMSRPELQVKVKREVISTGTDSLKGCAAFLLTETFFDTPRNLEEVKKEFLRRGWITTKLPFNKLSQALDDITGKGFLTREESGYQAVPGMKVNVVEA